MPFQESSGYCEHCRKKVLVRRATVNHLLHGLLSLFTCVWLPVWLVVALAGPGAWICSRCGSANLMK